MKIYLVRHAESLANTQGIYQGQTYDTGLSELGRKQTEALKNRLKTEDLEAIYSSPTLRCLETVEPLAKFKNLKTISEKRLLEINHGEWEGKTKGEVEKLFPEQLKKWKKQPSKIQMPNGENVSEVKKRVENFLEELKKDQRQKKVLLCSHDAVLRLLLAPLLEISFDEIWNIPLDNAAVTQLAWTSPWSIIKLNDKEHLKNILADVSQHAL